MRTDLSTQTSDLGQHRFPALEELSQDRNKYYLSLEHRQNWKTFMDCSKLRKLYLCKRCPKHLITALTGHVTRF